ncbi:hypothetical protein GS508_12725 [Rhodococcus hoagii]|nr:hypothetical protein [Prescottella equi]
MNVSGVVTMLDAASYTSITTPARKSIRAIGSLGGAAEPLTTPPVLYAAVLAAFTAVISGRLGMVIDAGVVVYDPAWVDALVDVSAASAADLTSTTRERCEPGERGVGGHTLPTGAQFRHHPVERGARVGEARTTAPPRRARRARVARAGPAESVSS